MMKKAVVILTVVISSLCGCITTKEDYDNGKNHPIVSPTVITNEVQDATDPVLPPYTPWWVEK